MLTVLASERLLLIAQRFNLETSRDETRLVAVANDHSNALERFILEVFVTVVLGSSCPAFHRSVSANVSMLSA